MTHDRITGLVVPGQGRGKKLGFPTANLKLGHGQIQPPTGVFAGRAKIMPAKPVPRSSFSAKEPQYYPAAVHIGPAPTFHDDTYRVEVHLLDYDGGTLYDQHLAVELIGKIREVKKFASEDDLKAAIAADCIATRELLDKNP
jgi:riboflavin kinase / FMN adenylyltransferase